MATNDAAVPCPFCGLGCDDLSLTGGSDSPRLEAAGCPKAEEGFSLALGAPAATPAIAGRRCTLDEAVEHAGRLLAEARLPLFAGLAGDLLDIQAALRLAEAAGGVVDHRNGAGLTAAAAALQAGGLMTTSLGDARNRADLWLLVGDVPRRFPRITERLLEPRERLHMDDMPEALVIGEAPPAGTSGGAFEHLPVPAGGLHDFIQVLRARLAGRHLDGEPDAGIEALVQRLGNARFPVIVYAPAALGDHGDLVIRALGGLVRTLNDSGRAALLPLGGGDGDVSAHQAAAWHSGFGMGTSFHSGVPEYDPALWSTGRLLASGEADLLVWVSSLDAAPPPATAVPTLVFGHPASRFDATPELFVPLAVPGVHRHGVVHRGDGPALLPLKALTASELPAGAEVFERLAAGLGTEVQS
ncbi:MAG: hypothetical protein U5S82_22000 [Gammaproteobacteria bacterium]|nr:hypothetical protein [Gammaproteobacteria bacterium]